MANELVKANENENQSLTEFSADLGFQPRTLEEFNLIKELLDAAAALDGIEFPKRKSIDLARDETVFDIVDAVVSTINTKVNTPQGVIDVPKQVVTFVVDIDAELFAVMKDGNAINLQYAEFFSKFKAIGKPQRRNGYQFIEAIWLPKTSGNHPVILQKAKIEKQIGKGK